MEATDFNLPSSVARTCLFLVNLVFCAGCYGGDDPATVAIVEKHLRYQNIGRGREDLKGVRRITRLGIRIDAKNRTEMLDLLPRLGKLEYLETLGIGGDAFRDSDLELLPPLPNLRTFSISPGSTRIPSNLTDAGLKYISNMIGLRYLSLRRSKVVGPGLAHLKSLDQLERLDLGSTPLDDSAMPHVAANFPKLRRFDFNNTKVTPEGLMQLVNLHWLGSIAVPNDLSGQSFHSIYDNVKDEKKRHALLQKRRETLRAIKARFNRSHLASKQEARAGGMDVPPDSRLPFGASGLGEAKDL